MIPEMPVHDNPLSSTPRPCQRCGVIDLPALQPGTGPHALKAVCAHCGGFLQWVSQHSPAERARRKFLALSPSMKGKPVSEAQRRFLEQRGIAVPGDRYQASERIGQIKAREMGG